MPKGSPESRIADLERHVAQLQLDSRASRNVTAQFEARRPVRLARTVAEEGEDYPTEGDTPNTYPIIFLDGKYDQESGDQDPDWTDRQSQARAVALNIVDGVYVPEDTIVSVWSDNRRWWMQFGLVGSQKLVKTNTAFAAGATHSDGVDLWDQGSAGSEAVSSPLVQFDATNRTLTAIASGQFCLMTLVTIDGDIVNYIDPWGGSCRTFKALLNGALTSGSSSATIDTVTAFDGGSAPSPTSAANFFGEAGPDNAPCMIVEDRSSGTVSYILMKVKYAVVTKVVDVSWDGTNLKETKQDFVGNSNSSTTTTNVDTPTTC